MPSSPAKGGLPLQEVEGTPDYQNLAVIRRNTLPPRCYYIPETSLLLNGRWDFCYSLTPEEAPQPGKDDGDGDGDADDDLTPNIWGAIDVPGHWQLQGHGQPQYTNTQFPMPVCPPFAPTENPTGTYRRSFHVPSTWRDDVQLRLRFDGVDCAYHVWVNGALVGYAEGSRNPSEFDVSGFAQRDESNELLVKVYQYSNATYIEDQDQWWLSGIFRDVHLIAVPLATRIEDWFIRTDLDADYENATLHATVDVKAADSETLTLSLSELPKNGSAVIQTRKVSVSEGDAKVELEFAVDHPKKWTAETPYLYRVDMKLGSHSVHQNIGFRKVEIKSGLMTVNGERIRLHGVNRHEHHPRFGRAVPLEFIKHDLLLMKSHNVNSLRCAHYPPHPRLFDLADELGLWVMDEADLEAHGFYDAIARPLDIPEEWDYDERKKNTFPPAARYTSDNPEWEHAYVDRMVQLVQRDKNHASIIMWSLGNEAFYGQNQKAMYEYGKTVDPTRPIHYEGDVEAETADMYSYMYPAIDRLIHLAKTQGVKEDGSFDKPIVLCEFGHAMGNGPGWLPEYVDAFDTFPRLQGGWIWEWANHGLWKEDTDGGGYYAYGGDFGEWPHDGTFVMDGLLHSSHDPTPGLIELKKAYQPLELSVEGDKLIVKNKYDFASLEHLTATYKIEEFGEDNTVLAAGNLEMPCVPAGKTVSVDLPPSAFSIRSDSEVFMTIVFRFKEATNWAEPSHEIAWIQHELSVPGLSAATTAGPPLNTLTSKLNVTKSRARAMVSGLDFNFTFDTARGLLTSWVVGGVHLLEKDATTGAAAIPNFWRPATDNDKPVSLPYWQRFGVHKLTNQLRSLEILESNEGSVEITTKTFLSPPVLEWGFETLTTYTISATGRLTINVSLHPSGKIPVHVPRAGLNLRLPKSLDRVKYLGLGPGESYPDKQAAQRVGVYAAAVPELHQHYEVPQENGNRMAARYVDLTTSHGRGIRVTASQPEAWTREEWRRFSWKAGRYSDEVVQEAKHPCDLVEDDATLLRLDARVAGVGTGACGPGVREDLLVKTEAMKFGFVLERVGF